MTPSSEKSFKNLEKLRNSPLRNYEGLKLGDNPSVNKIRFVIIMQSLKSTQGSFVEKKQEKRPLGVVASILDPLGVYVSGGALLDDSVSSERREILIG